MNMDLPSITVTAEGPAVENPSPALLAHLLGEFEVESRAHVGHADGALPGLPRTEVTNAFADIGLVPPEELIVLFGWHNGVSVGHPSPFPRLGFTPLAELCRNYTSRQRMFEQFDEDDLQYVTWGAGPGWFPLVPTQYMLAVDCTREPDMAPRVRFTDIEFDELETPRRSGQIVSLCTLVTWWITGMRSGAHTWNDGTQYWETHDALLPELQRQFGVV